MHFTLHPAVSLLVTAFALATTVMDPVALLGLPALLGSWWSARGIYGGVQRSTQDKLESFLDRLEHNELKVPGPRTPPWGGGGFSVGGNFGGFRIGGPPRDGGR